LEGKIEGFDWDAGNTAKCAKRGISREEIESVFDGPVTIVADQAHSGAETRLRAIGRTGEGRHVFIVYTIRRERIRPISARYMHAKEIRRYDKKSS
jgi:uncharacterized DUF497 family protein